MSQEVSDEFEEQINNLKSSIERVGIRQDEIKAYIFDVQSMNDDIKLKIKSLTKEQFEIKVKMQIAISKNYELINDFYNTVSSFESIRQRYEADISKLTKEKLYLINVSMQQIQNKTESASQGMIAFVKEMKSFVNAIQTNKIELSEAKDLEADPIYSME